MYKRQPYGSVRVSGTSYYDLSDEQVLSGIVAAALRSGGEQGLLHDYSLRYLRTTWRGNEYIIFADVSSANATMQNLWRSCILIGLCAAAVFLAVSFLLARWAVKPVERAWTQQKQFVSDASHELETVSYTHLLLDLLGLTVAQTHADLQRGGVCGVTRLALLLRILGRLVHGIIHEGELQVAGVVRNGSYALEDLPQALVQKPFIGCLLYTSYEMISKVLDGSALPPLCPKGYHINKIYQ